MNHKIINLWTHPRSLSTAFYRSIYERGDLDTIFEPFVHMYYKKVFVRKKACRNDYANKKYFTKYEDIKKSILQKSQSNNIFIKDMAYCVADYIDDSFLSNSINVFLIRDPKKSLPSFYHVLTQNGYFSDKFIKFIPFNFIKGLFLKHVGYTKLWELYDKCCNFSVPLVIDASDFEANPKAVLEEFCKYTKIPYINTLKWDQRQIDDFKFAGTKMFHDNISKSNGINSQTSNYEKTVENNKLLNKFYDHSISYYEKLFNQRHIFT
jgi:hypothetical protein